VTPALPEPVAARTGAGGVPAGPAADQAERARRLAARLGHQFSRPALLEQALAHRSWCGEQGNAPSNERLEFLGDAVLSLVVAEHAYAAYPAFAEGRLAKMRSAVVNARALAEVAQTLGVGDELLLGRGEESSGGREKASILADALEAVIGALYLDAGYERVRALLLGLLGERVRRAASEPDDFDHKSRLQEWTVRQGVGTPRYLVVGDGPDHDRHYVAEVYVAGTAKGRGEGSSKKDAEQAAARDAWEGVERA
jgi:ribonuclease-3